MKSQTIAGALLLVLSVPVVSQRLASKPLEVSEYGLRLRAPHDWRTVPVEPRLAEAGVVARLHGLKVATRIQTEVVELEPELYLLAIGPARDDRRASEERTRGRSIDGALLVPELFRGMRRFDEDDPQVDEELTVRGSTLRHRLFEARQTYPEGRVPVTIDLWEMQLGSKHVVFCFRLPSQHANKWAPTFKKCAKSLVAIDAKEVPDLSEDPDYDELLAFHSDLAERTEGWRAIGTPSRKYIVKTSSKNKRFLDEVIEQLERAREIFERDYPPHKPIRDVAIVRICSDAFEFQQYGDTREGIVGWFSARTEELVLYDSVETDRNKTYAVMLHEAFHQYCHFLFDGSQAHPWFDEGHGDYYGGLRFSSRRVQVAARMPGSLNRLETIRQMIREGTQAPLGVHMRVGLAEWRQLGPGSTGPYAQSWSLVYFLRQGAQGEVNRKVWKPAYSTILPRYVKALREGYVQAFEELRIARLRQARSEGLEPEPHELEREGLRLSGEQRRAILDGVLDEALEGIDLDGLEEDWRLFVRRYLEG